MATVYTRSLASTSTSWTFSAWVKKQQSGGYILSWGNSGTDATGVGFSGDKFIYYSEDSPSNIFIQTTALYRDVNGWYHVVCKCDAGAITLYVNGESAATGTGGNPLDTSTMRLGDWQTGSGNEFFGLVAHLHFIDGTAYNADSFGSTDSTTGIWKPITSPSVTYGSNGFFLNFENSSDMGNDVSGNNNDFTYSSGTLSQTIDTPSNVFATMNRLATSTTAGSFSNGNTTHTKTNSTWASTTSTLAASSGKYYAEYKFTANSSSSNGQMAAIVNMDLTNYMYENSDLEQNGNKGITYYANGTVFADPQVTVGTYSSYGDAIIQIAMDLDNNRLYFGKDGTWQNSADPAAGTGGINISNYIGTGTYAFGLANRNTGSTSVNFGNGYFGTTAVASAGTNSGIGTFEYDVPSGYKALCTKNINEQEYS